MNKIISIFTAFSVSFIILTGCDKSEKKEQDAFVSAIKFSEDTEGLLSRVTADQKNIAVNKMTFISGDEVLVDGTTRPVDLSSDSDLNSVVKLSSLSPANFQQACWGKNLQQCAGHTVHGTGYVSLAIPGHDYRVISGNFEFQLRLPQGVTPAKLQWFDKIKFSGVLDASNDHGGKQLVKDAIITAVSDFGTSVDELQRKGVQLAAICLADSLQKSAKDSLERGWMPSVQLRDVTFKKITIHPTKPLTGVVLAALTPSTEACIIESGMIKASFIEGSKLTPTSLRFQENSKYIKNEYEIWLDRVSELKRREDFSLALKKDEQKKQDEFDALSNQEKFKRASESLESSAEAIGSFIGQKSDAQLYLMMCNEEMRMAIDAYKGSGRATVMKGAEKLCTQKARELCSSDYEKAVCERMRSKSLLPW
nr:hypothetical protein [uncultured Duganella sp.]